jgi:hypothetical protein
MFEALKIMLTVASVLAANPRRSEICVSREEDGGLMNLVPVRIFARRNGHETLLVELTGGARECARVTPGKWALDARSHEPYDPNPTDPAACRSAPVRVEVARSRSVRLRVSPKSHRSTYLCGWNLVLLPPP